MISSERDSRITKLKAQLKGCQQLGEDCAQRSIEQRRRLTILERLLFESINTLRTYLEFLESEKGPLFSEWELGMIGNFVGQSLDWPQTLDIIKNSDENLWAVEGINDTGEVARYRQLRDLYDQLVARSTPINEVSSHGS